MAENCGFRSKFGGFNKEDVLIYINALQEEHSRELAMQQQAATVEREAYEKALSEANAALEAQHTTLLAEREEQEKLQALINEQYEANRELRIQLAETEDARKSYAALVTRVTELEAENAAVKRDATQKAAAAEQELRRELAALRTEKQRLQAENQRYHELVSEVGRFVVEVRGMGARFLEEANERCATRLSSLADAITTLHAALDVAAKEFSAAEEALTVQNSHAEQRLMELADELERSAAAVEQASAAAGDGDFF